MFETITVPVDGSEYGDKAVDVAIEIAKKFNSKIAAVHVLEEFSFNSYADEEDSGDAILGKITEKASKYDIPVIEHLITGDPLRDMKTIIRKTSADLVVIHAHGKHTAIGQTTEAPVGSVVDRVVETSPVPILIVKD